MDRLAGALVLRTDSAGALRALASVRSALTEAEKARAARLRSSDDREDYFAAHLLVRECAARWSGVPAHRLTLRQLCPGCGSPTHGRPYIEELPWVAVSLSHTRGHVAAAAGAGPVAVDVENHRRTALSQAARREVLTNSEHAAIAADPDPDLAFCLRWTYKECLVKQAAASWGQLRTVSVPQSLRPDGVPVGADMRWAVQWVDDQGASCGTAVTTGNPVLLGFEGGT
ncbi:4'-phosphopantetheinyl transferase superfamily protein [Streptomyces sp. ITFR-6]|uniref:4'-phosphopantetheinyl transferase family protein n=1 Tax=Streptomyces sp. ITFR-6 TaxID=3075197 RepID=UPI00288AFD85|nr:4'-phosphopantetheinyl transferase superfamily protein [Streptomyces sp. ITFR-6]WNI30970.1 4'-phosphopantetheinyl transferase superfamily protein [Streptomyces sp. ITFR-6]